MVREVRSLDSFAANPLGGRAVTAPADDPAGWGGRADAEDVGTASRAPDEVMEPPGGAWVRRLDPGQTVPPGGGPLAGMVVGVKDLVAVAGLPVGAGSRTRSGAPPEPRDAALVAQLRGAGAQVAGTLALHELAFGVTGINDQVGFPPNPRHPGRVPGGSSSGSAVAVATGQCALAVGTDTGGSVRIPAALCGVVGFKPRRGRYPLEGVLALSPSLDHVGLLARTLDPIVAAHQALTGDVVSPTPPQRLGVDRLALESADDEVAGTVDQVLQAIEATGCELVVVAWPDPTEMVEVSSTIMFAEAAAVHRLLLASPEASLLGPDVADRLTSGACVTEAEYRAAWVAAAELEAAARAVLATVDGVVAPTTPTVAPTIAGARGDHALARRMVRTTRLANLTGLPAVTLPLSTTTLPVGLHLAAATDRQLLALAASFAPVLPP